MLSESEKNSYTRSCGLTPSKHLICTGLYFNSSKLKPCPFCGSSDIGFIPQESATEQMSMWLVRCFTCPCQMKILSNGKHMTNILTNWNQRYVYAPDKKLTV